MFIDSIILLSPHFWERTLGQLICPEQRDESERRREKKKKMRDVERVKEFHLEEEGGIMSTFIPNWKIMKKD